MSWSELEHFQTGAAALLLFHRPEADSSFVAFFCRSYSIIFASGEPALIHSFLLWVKKGVGKINARGGVLIRDTWSVQRTKAAAECLKL